MKIALILGGIAAFVGLLVYMTMGQRQVRVEVCMEFQGRRNCAIASGPTRESTLRTATDNACGAIASGMTASMTCGATPPASVKWLTR